MDKHGSHITDIPVAAKDKTLLRNKLGHLEENKAGLFAIKGVLARFYNAPPPPPLSSAEKDKGVHRFFKALIVEFVKARLHQ